MADQSSSSNLLSYSRLRKMLARVSPMLSRLPTSNLPRSQRIVQIHHRDGAQDLRIVCSRAAKEVLCHQLGHFVALPQLFQLHPSLVHDLHLLSGNILLDEQTSQHQRLVQLHQIRVSDLISVGYLVRLRLADSTEQDRELEYQVLGTSSLVVLRYVPLVLDVGPSDCLARLAVSNQ